MPVITTASEFIALFAAAGLFGAMVFFPIVVAPTVFATLPEQTAGRFLRAVFPAYYAFVAANAGLCAVALMLIGESWSIAAWAIALSTLVVRQVLVPKINFWRDAELEGEPGAKEKFDTGHKISVLINAGQIILAVALVYVAGTL